MIRTSEHFNLTTLLKAILPAYIFPALMAGTSGLLLNDMLLVNASYTSIAIPSFLSALFCFLLLWKFDKEKKLPEKKVLRIVMCLGISLFIAAGLIYSLNLHALMFDIILSTCIGSVITVWRQPIEKIGE